MGLGSPTVVRICCAVIALPLLLTIIVKCLMHPVLVLGTDMASPIVAPVSATVFMSLMQVATYIAHTTPDANQTPYSCRYRCERP